MIAIYQTIDGKLTEVPEISSGCWVNIYPPFDYKAIEEISEKLGVYIEYFTDALDIDEQSRYEEDDDTKFILLNAPIRNDNLVNTTRASFITIPISIVIKDQIVITTSKFKNPVIDSVISKSSRKPLFQDIATLVLHIFDRNTDFFHHYLKQINLRFNDFEKIIDTQATNKDFVTILQLQKSLIYFETNLRSNNLMMVKMKRTNFLDTRDHEEYDDFFDEIIVENQQAIEMTEVYSRILDSSMQTISSIISNNVNSIVKRLTGATIILMIPSIISGLWGMNVPVPWSQSPYGFIIISIGTISLISGVVYLFFKKRWI